MRILLWTSVLVAVTMQMLSAATIPSAVKDAADSVAYISSTTGAGTHGSAVALGQGPLLLTAYHVVRELATNNEMKVEWSPLLPGGKTATVTYVWPDFDLALLRLDTPVNRPRLPLARDVPSRAQVASGGIAYHMFPVGFTTWDDRAPYFRAGWDGVKLALTGLAHLPDLWRIIDHGTAVGGATDNDDLAFMRKHASAGGEGELSLADDLVRSTRVPDISASYWLLSNAWTTGGQSGGAVFNAEGALAGINSMCIDTSKDPAALEYVRAHLPQSSVNKVVSFPIPVAMVRIFLAGVDAGGKPDSAFLARYYDLGGPTGIGYPLDDGAPVWIHHWGSGVIQSYIAMVDGQQQVGALMRNDGDTVVYYVHGAIWATYASSGGSDKYGYPTSEERDCPQGREQSFQKATLRWDGVKTTVLAPGQPSGQTTTGTHPGGKPGERQGSRVGEEIAGPDGGTYVWVPPGEFTMGADVGANAQPLHRARITKGFWLAQCEVTNDQYRSFCQATGRQFPPESDQPGDHPVCCITWDDAIAYCNHYGLRLPTEAEWEYAARGLSGRLYPWGETWRQDACCYKDHQGPGGKTLPVGSLAAGASWCGALDMLGSVWEWCNDSLSSYTSDLAVDPETPAGDSRIFRGGSWANIGDYNCSTRFAAPESTTRAIDIGFRTCLTSGTSAAGSGGGPSSTSLASKLKTDNFNGLRVFVVDRSGSMADPQNPEFDAESPQLVNELADEVANGRLRCDSAIVVDFSGPGNTRATPASSDSQMIAQAMRRSSVASYK